MAGKDLFCALCDVKPQLRAQEEKPDGTIVHTVCGKPLDLVAPTPAPKKRSTPRQPKAKRVKTAPQARSVPVGLVSRLLDVLADDGLDVAVHLEPHDVAGRRGWKLEAYLPGA